MFLLILYNYSNFEREFFQVKTPFVLSDEIGMISLPKANQVIAANQKAVVSGWGISKVSLMNNFFNYYILTFSISSLISQFNSHVLYTRFEKRSRIFMTILYRKIYFCITCTKFSTSRACRAW